MKNAIYSLIIVLGLIDCEAKAQTWAWLKDIETSSISNITNTKSTSDINGNTFVAGNYGELVMGGDLYIDNTTLTSTNGQEYFVVKYNANGTAIWAKSFGTTTGFDEFSDIVCDASGNVYVAGIFTTSLTIDGTTLNSNQLDFFLLKFNSAGVLQWAQQSNTGIASSSSVISNIKLAIDLNNNCFVVGNYTNTCVLGSGANTSAITSIGEADIFISKYNTSGVLQWVKSIGSIDVEYSTDVDVSPNGNAVFTGTFGTSTTNTININGNTFTSVGGTDIFIAMYNTNGNYVWATTAGSAANENAEKICVDQNSNVYVTGTFGGSTGASANFGTTTLTSAGRSDVFLAKYSSTGNIAWAKSGGGTTSDRSYDVDFNKSNGVIYLAVLGSSTANFGGLSVSTGVKIVKYSSDGNALELISAGNSMSNFNVGISNNNLFCKGSYSNTLTLGANSVSIAPNNAGTAIFIGRYNEVAPPAPSLTSFTPLEGVVGSSVIIKGKNLSGVTSVSFNDINAITFKELNDSTIIAIVPSNASTGKIKVSIPNNILTSTNDFTVKTISNTSYAWQWAIQSTTTASASQIINDMCTDISGNTYSIGAYKNSFSIGSNSLTSLGFYDAYIIKNDANGNVLWMKNIGGAIGDDIGYGISTDIYGNVFITGYFTGTISVENTNLNSYGDKDIFIMKFTSNGNLIWAKQAGGINQDIAYDIKADAFGNFYLTGNFFDSGDFGGINLNTSSFYVKSFVAMFDADGNGIWAKEVTGTANNYGNSVSFDALGNCYVMGYFSIGLNFGGVSITSSTNNISYFLAKYNNTGNLVWAKKIDGDFIANTNNMTHIIADPTGNIFIAGCENISNTKESMIAKYSTNGNLLWKKTAISLGQNFAYDIALANNGELSVVGQISGATSFDNINLETQNLFGNEMYVLRIDAQGNPISSYQPVNSNVNSEKCYAVCMDNYGNIYTTGYFSGSPAFGSTNLTTTTMDIFVAKITSNAVGINEFKNETILAYPNPVYGNFLFVTNSSTEPYSIINSFGQIVDESIIEENKIDVSDLAPGLYTLKCRSGITKFVIKK